MRTLLRRDAAYRAAAAGARFRRAGRLVTLEADPLAGAWGLHAFEYPDVAGCDARPVWLREWLAGVPMLRAIGDVPEPERLSLARVADMATVVRGSGEVEHILFSDGVSTIRVDLMGSLLDSRSGIACDVGPSEDGLAKLAVAAALVDLCRHGRIRRRAPDRRMARRVLQLRAADALAQGATQREIAAVLLSGEARQTRWRSELSSLRSRAQRLVRGARAMADGGYRQLLRQDREGPRPRSGHAMAPIRQ